MRAMFLFNKRKNALSNVIAYVLLISITLSLSVLVYGWLRFYVSESNLEKCSDNVNIIIKSYECFEGANGNLTVTLKNKGLFSVDGYILRVHDRDEADFGFYTFDNNNIIIKPGEEYSKTYSFINESSTEKTFNTITLVEVQPFIMEEGQISCETYASQKVICK